MPTDRAGLNDGLDVLRPAGEDGPSPFSRRGASVQTTAAGGIALVDIPRVLRWCAPELRALGLDAVTDGLSATREVTLGAALHVWVLGSGGLAHGVRRVVETL
jgi:hypothetical protein